MFWHRTPSLAIVSGQGGAAGQRERVAELVMMAGSRGGSADYRC
ncbi:hypothetical protein ECP030230811_5036 [Escherichia coli P0302308.11]|nr:hypothetical protein ECP030230811_5036 [Escherichia coli P0302308.11]